MLMDTSNAIGRIIGSSLVLQKLWEQPTTWFSNRKSHIKGLGLLFGVSTKIVGTSKLILHPVVQYMHVAMRHRSLKLVLFNHAVMTTRSLTIILVCNTQFLRKMVIFSKKYLPKISSCFSSSTSILVCLLSFVYVGWVERVRYHSDDVKVNTLNNSIWCSTPNLSFALFPMTFSNFGLYFHQKCSVFGLCFFEKKVVCIWSVM